MVGLDDSSTIFIPPMLGGRLIDSSLVLVLHSDGVPTAAKV